MTQAEDEHPGQRKKLEEAFCIEARTQRHQQDGRENDETRKLGGEMRLMLLTEWASDLRRLQFATNVVVCRSGRKEE